jgi:hypothetical protein
VSVVVGDSTEVRKATRPTPDLAQENRDKRVVYVRAVVGLIIGVIRSILIGRLLAPSGVALFRVVTVWAGYFGFLSLGTSDTLHFRGPWLVRSGGEEEFRKLRGTALAMSLFAGLVGGTGTVVLAMLLGLTDLLTATLLGLLAVITLLVPFFNSTLWAQGRFRHQARYEVWGAVIGTLAIAIGLVTAGVRGLIAGNIIGLLCGLWLVRDVVRFGDIKMIQISAAVASVAFGIKQTTLVFLQGVVLSIDLQVLSLATANAAMVGYYAFAGMLVVAVRTAATAGGIVAQTNLMARHGDSQVSTDRDLCIDAEYQRRVDTALVGLVCAASLIAVSLATQFVFPRYRSSLEPFAAMLLSVTTIRWGFFHAVALSSRGLHRRTILFAAAGVLVAGVWTYAGSVNGWSLALIALAPALGSGFYAILTVIFAWRRLYGSVPLGPFARMGMAILALIPMLGVSAERPWYLNAGYAVTSILVQIFVLRITDPNALRNVAHIAVDLARLGYAGAK